jgi:hypothetical protein
VFVLRITLAIAATSLLVSIASATQLIFEPASGGFSDFVELPQGYGDRVTSASQGGFAYGIAGGPTPNVVARFGSPQGMVPLYTWSTNFGDLTHVLFAQEPVPFEFRLIADAGYVVNLVSFDMAGWPYLDFPSIASVSVEDGVGNVLFSQTRVPIYGTTPGQQHSAFNFTGVVASELRIKYDSTTDGFGQVLDSDDVGLDNITFGQSSTVDVSQFGGATSDRLAVVAGPSPFRDRVRLSVQLPRAAHLKVDVYDLHGSRVAGIEDGPAGAGEHHYEWDGRDAAGRMRGAGVYWVMASSEGRRAAKSVVFIR